MFRETHNGSDSVKFDLYASLRNRVRGDRFTP